MAINKKGKINKMKKLMIAAAIVCAAVVSQGATAYWNFLNAAVDGVIYDSSYASAYTGTGYIYMLDAGITQDDVLTAFRAGNAPSGAFATVDIVNGVFNKAGVTSEATGEDHEFFLALVDKQNILLSDSYEFSENTMEVGRDVDFALQWISEYDEPIMASDVTFADKMADSDYGEGWYASSSVPEPTSGLLLLLGVGALALRRRRA